MNQNAIAGKIAKKTPLRSARYLLGKFGGMMLRRTAIVEIACALLIILWIYTGLNKLLDYKEFRFQLGRSPFLSDISNFVSLTLPAGELLIAFALVFRTTRIIGLYASFFLMVLFTAYIYAMLQFSFYVPCSCGGVLASLSWEDHLIFNGAFTLIALIGLILHSTIIYRKSSTYK